MRSIFSETKLHEALLQITEWRFAANSIERWFEFPSFAESIAFVQRVAVLADAMDHHPDIDIRYRRVRVTLSTHSAGGVTDLDVSAAKEIANIQIGG
jgi:4a-hydroxytetrahydrobiopterin dehydratase